MNSKVKKIIGMILVLIVLAVVGYYLFKKNIGVVNIPGKAGLAGVSSKDISPNLPGFQLPEGFSLRVFAKDVPGARVMAFDDTGDMLVSETSEGKIVAIPDRDNNGLADKVVTLASKLNKPHGIVFKRLNHDSGGLQCAKGECQLYVAEADQLSVYDYQNTDSDQSLTNKRKLMSISSSVTDRHFTRSLLFRPAPDEDTLLISVGSSCDVCNDSGDHASVLAYNTKTGEKSVYAKGLRNATFMTLNPVNGKIYATEMGRDGLGDNIPPDEINIINGPSTSSGQSLPPNFGWPICYGQNIHDAKFDKNTYIRNPCLEPFETPSFVDLQAHSAPLGLAFVPADKAWPEEYQNNLLVAYHGSWNRSTPTGYKIVRLKMNGKGEYLGTEDFISGWLTKDGKKTGRPVDIKVLPGGTAYISDDSSGVIYKLSKN
jgi:glucose/arabinose dehydrogenase